MSEIINISADQFEKEVIKSKVPVLVDFWATWCGPCLMMGPVLEDIAKELGQKAKIVKIDIDESQNKVLAQSFQIRSIPCMKIFVNGKEVNEFLGVTGKDELVEGIKKII